MKEKELLGDGEGEEGEGCPDLESSVAGCCQGGAAGVRSLAAPLLPLSASLVFFLRGLCLTRVKTKGKWRRACSGVYACVCGPAQWETESPAILYGLEKQKAMGFSHQTSTAPRPATTTHAEQKSHVVREQLSEEGYPVPAQHRLEGFVNSSSRRHQGSLVPSPLPAILALQGGGPRIFKIAVFFVNV